jgi:hypothetical protein
MDCSTARLLLFFSHPDHAEADGESLHALENHLQQCSECETLASTERSIEKRIAQAVRNVPVPGDLHARIIERLTTERRLRRRRLLVEHPRTAAGIAAAFLAISLLVLYWATRTLPEFDPESRLNVALEQRDNTPPIVEKWFQENHGIAVVAPPNFNYALLDHYHLVLDPSGAQLPELIFVSGADRARVLILTNKQFDLKATLLKPAANSGGLRVEYLPHPGRTDVGYVVVHNGSSLDWLISNGQPAA